MRHPSRNKAVLDELCCDGGNGAMEDRPRASFPPEKAGGGHIAPLYFAVFGPKVVQVLAPALGVLVMKLEIGLGEVDFESFHRGACGENDS